MSETGLSLETATMRMGLLRFDFVAAEVTRTVTEERLERSLAIRAGLAGMTIAGELGIVGESRPGIGILTVVVR